MSLKYGTRKTTVEEELEKNSKLLRIDDIKKIQSWLQKQSHLPKIPDCQVILFLHASSYSVQESKKLIENYYTMRTRFSHYFLQRDPLNPNIQQTMNIAPSVIYGEDIYNRRILWSKLLDNDSTLYYPTIATKIMFMVYDIDQIEHGTVPGYTLVLDGKGFGFNHAMRCSFTNGKQVTSYVQTASTIIIEKVYLLNMNPAIEKILLILKPFIRSELINKITICDDITKMNEIIPKEVTPADYNGKAPSIEILADLWNEKLKKYREWFLDEENVRVNESKRINDIITTDEMKFGTDGSFKTLTID